MSEEKVLRKNELESFFEKYPDVPKEVIVKEDIIRNAMKFSRGALHMS